MRNKKQVQLTSMTKINLDEIQTVALEAANAAGKLIMQARQDDSFEINSKLHLEPVTSADVAADKLVVETIKRKYPDHRLLSEELAPDLSKVLEFESPLWIIDPIDGTTNFLYGQPAVGISIAFMVDAEVKVAVVHAPFLNETYSSIKGKGAKLNGKPIQVNSNTSLKGALVATGFPYRRDDVETLVARVNKVLKNCRDLRRVGAASIDLCWVGCGRHDAYYESVKPWDIAAGLLIAREAGAKAGFLSPSKSGLPESIDGYDRITATPGLFEQLRALLES